MSHRYTDAVTPASNSTSQVPSTAPLPRGSDESPLLVILDSHGIIFRSYYALRDVLPPTRTQEPIAAVYGYANSLLTVFRELSPTHVIAAWDATEDTFRKVRDERYKAHRDAVPDDLVPQFGRVRELLDAFRIPVVEKMGYEADDILGTLAEQAHERAVEVVIVTLDNDMIQLVQPGVSVYMYRPYQKDYILYDTDTVHDRFGFDPKQMVEYKSLVGDTSDNIPGVRGIGEKGAKALIDQYGTLEEMIEHLAEVEPKRTRTALENGLDEAILSKELATIVRDVPEVELDLDAARLKDYDRQTVVDLFHALEFRSLIARLPASDGDDAAALVAPSDEPDGTYTTITSREALEELATQVKKSGQLAYLVIADDGHPVRASQSLVGIAISAEPGQAAYVPFGHHIESQGSLLDDESDGVTQLSRDEVFEVLGPVFTEPGVRRYAHDTKYGMLALGMADASIWPASDDFDTQVAAYLLGDANISLQRLAFGRLRKDTVDPKTFLGTASKAIPFSRASVEDVAHYACVEVDMVPRLVEPLRTELDESALLGVFEDVDMPHVPVLARMEQWGIALDLGVLDTLNEELTEKIAAAEQACYDAVGHEIKIGSPQELSHVLFEEIGLPKTRKTKTGYTTDADALEPLRSVHPIVEAILNWRELTKIKSTYVDTLPHQVNPATGRVHTVFSQVTAATGRLASNDPNLQNIPVRSDIGQLVRGAFVARDCGDAPVFLAIDYSQIELRVLAHISGDEELRRAFLEGKDIHRATASNVFKKPEDEVTAEDRRRAKVFNFGVLYGLTAFGMSTREGIPRDEAEAFITAYFHAYPKVQEWREQTVEEARDRGYAETLTGRRRYMPDLKSGNRVVRQAAERIAINMPIQGTASDIIKLAMNRIDEELLERRRQGALARILLQVHDELIFELPRAELDDVREVARRLMPSMELAVPLDLDEKVGTSWGDMRPLE
ncbi:MAG: DNA polymerase I [Chloroflexi bacterium]|nr:DNA polymerase I [Chloroflexota bacterium]